MTRDPSEVIYDGNAIDHDTVFIHSATEADFMRAGRIEYRREDYSPRAPYFVAEDAEFAGKRIYVNDGLEQGKVFTRTSPPAVTYGDFSFVHGEEDGEPVLTIRLDKMDFGYIFGRKSGYQWPEMEERMLDVFRRNLEWKHSQYTPV